MNAARYQLLNDGNYLVRLEVETQKFYADSVGNQVEALLNDYIYVGLMDEGRKLITTKNIISPITNSIIEIVTNKKPVKAGIDPYWLAD